MTWAKRGYAKRGYVVINEHDPSVRFIVEAETAEDAAFEALEQLGYYISDEPVEDEDDEDVIDF